MSASTRTDFVPTVGVESDIVRIMFDYLEPVHGDDCGTGVIIGQEQCAAKIVEMLREKGIEV
jgi:hypothetical protein